MKYLIPKRSDLIKVPDKLEMNDFPYIKRETLITIMFNWREEGSYIDPFIRKLKDVYRAKKFNSRISSDYYLFKDSNTYAGDVYVYLPVNEESPIITFDDIWRLSPYFGKKGYAINRIRQLVYEQDIIYTYKTSLGDFEFIPMYYGNMIVNGVLDFHNGLTENNLDIYFDEY